MTHIRFRSTRGRGPGVLLSEAIRSGLAPDGGLYIPTYLPPIDVPAVRDPLCLPQVARAMLAGFFAGDRLESQLGSISDEALDIRAPTTQVIGSRSPLFALELHHGPTAAFKDYGARFLAESLERLQDDHRRLTILVATSGDTGGAVAAAFHRKAWARVVILYPKGLVSPRQEQQLTCWDDNVVSLRVDGTFDDCQRLVKEAFQDAALDAQHRVSSANSINIGRLLPQSVYYASSSMDVMARTGSKPSYIIPAGNVGRVNLNKRH